MNRQKVMPIVWGLFSLVLLPSVLVAQPAVKANLFSEAKYALEEAKLAKANLLAPKNFGEAMDHYKEAESDYEEGKNLDDIRKQLRAATAYFNKATKATLLAEVTFRSATQARSDAISVDAYTNAAEDWEEAEKKFAEAAEELENGDVNDAKEKGAEAEKIYRQAELKAIKSFYLSETRKLLKQADDKDVDDRAPKTLKYAETLAKKADYELGQNRYDTDMARSLAREAKYEAKHALYLSEKIKQLKDADYEFEDLILAGERPLQSIAAAFDMNAEFDEGMNKPAERIIEHIHAYRDSVESLRQDIIGLQQQNEILNIQIAQLENQLGAAAKEQTELQKKIQAREKVREQFETVGTMFNREEARVLRDGKKVIMRLVGLNFAVGKSEIAPENFNLLTKVQNAIKTFPGCELIIEGHTDSHGGDELNLKLSQERADAVKAYLIANMQFEASRITAVGHGEVKPIGNNETKEGRAKNRRIDVIIYPSL